MSRKSVDSVHCAINSLEWQLLLSILRRQYIIVYTAIKAIKAIKPDFIYLIVFGKTGKHFYADLSL